MNLENLIKYQNEKVKNNYTKCYLMSIRIGSFLLYFSNWCVQNTQALCNSCCLILGCSFSCRACPVALSSFCMTICCFFRRFCTFPEFFFLSSFCNFYLLPLQLLADESQISSPCSTAVWESLYSIYLVKRFRLTNLFVAVIVKL